MLHFFSRKSKTNASPSDTEGIIQFGEMTESPPAQDEEEIELPIDLLEDRGCLILRAPMVGASEGDISVVVRGNQITISKNGSSQENEGRDSIIQECYWGPLSRTITLENPFQADKISAKLEKGVLTIRIPLVKERTKIIPIEDAEEKNN